MIFLHFPSVDLHKFFYDFNLSLYQPKKDACNTCKRYKTGNSTVEEYETHILKKIKLRQKIFRNNWPNLPNIYNGFTIIIAITSK